MVTRNIYAGNDFSTQFRKIIFDILKIVYNIRYTTDCMYGSQPTYG